MARSLEEVIIRDMAKNNSIKWGTNAPFEFPGDLRIIRHGFADIPVVQVDVICRPEDKGAMVPLVRQAIWQKMEAHGLESEIFEFVPTVQTQGRQRMFTDQNESSKTHGKRKRGVLSTFSFEIKKEQIGHFNWNGRHGSFQNQ